MSMTLIQILTRLISKLKHLIGVSSMPKFTAEEYIQKLNLQSHIEGGYFNEFYKAKDLVNPVETEKYVDGARSAGTSIYFMLNKEGFSAWHRLKSDEIWHFYDGSPIDIHVIDPNTRKLTTHTVGNPIDDNKAQFQVVIPAGCWFAAEVRDKSSFGLVGCTVNPGFEYKDFELANKKAMAYQYPAYKDIIERLAPQEDVVEEPKQQVKNTITNTL